MCGITTISAQNDLLKAVKTHKFWSVTVKIKWARDVYNNTR